MGNYLPYEGTFKSEQPLVPKTHWVPAKGPQMQLATSETNLLALKCVNDQHLHGGMDFETNLSGNDLCCLNVAFSYSRF